VVIALFVGIALNSVATRPLFNAGLAMCVKVLLRVAIALLGLRVALGDIIAIGPSVALLVIVAMVGTTLAGFGLARLFKQNASYGALAGAATAVCGASATLATSTVVPDYPGKDADVAFVIVAVNALSTLAMVAYPVLCIALGFDDHKTGVLLGASIHDVAQVVASGYSVSETAGNTALLVKLFRVFLLLPAVLSIGWWLTRSEIKRASASVPVPTFALVFLGLCLLNTAMSLLPHPFAVFSTVKAALGEVSNWGLLIAISALGLGTPVRMLATFGWRRVATVAGTTIVILAISVGGLLMLDWMQ
jgi:uncharacterized integral membrane protein (TIGR00698 family)